MDFTGKIVVVTGAASGIGRETATMFGQRGATVVIADIQEEMANTTAESLKSKGIAAQAVKTDITNHDHIQALFSTTIALYQSVDILVNCAGIGRLTRVPEITPEEWDLVLAINLKSVFFCSEVYIRKARHLFQKYSEQANRFFATNFSRIYTLTFCLGRDDHFKHLDSAACIFGCFLG